MMVYIYICVCLCVCVFAHLLVKIVHNKSALITRIGHFTRTSNFIYLIVIRLYDCDVGGGGGNESDLRTKTKLTFRKREESISDLNLLQFTTYVL